MTKGLEVTFEELIGLQKLSSQLSLSRIRSTRALSQGNIASAFRGRGMEFAEVRPYEYGDDVRHIDWAVTARTSRPHTKVYYAERERPVYFIVDQRSSMRFATRQAFKSVIAANITALLAWVAERAGDRVGGLIFDDNSIVNLKPIARKKGVLSILYGLLKQCGVAHSTTDLETAVKTAKAQCRGGHLVFILSDFNDFNPEVEKSLYSIRQHNDVFAIRITDYLEHQAPSLGTYAVTDGHSYSNVCINNKWRLEYETQMQSQRQAVSEKLVASRIPLLDIDTRDDWLQLLRQVFRK